jgi:hypothetical protein
VSFNQLGPVLAKNWNNATSLIELDLAGNSVESTENLPLSKMTRLLELDVRKYILTNLRFLIMTIHNI